MRQPLNGGRRIVSVSDGRQDINSTSDGRIMHGAFRSPPFSTGSETEGKAGRASFFFFSRVTRGLLEVQEERLINYYHYYDHA